MPAITAANVTLTPIGKGTKEYNKEQDIQVVFGNGTLTYPTNGIPLTGLSAAGFPNSVNSVTLFSPSASDGYAYKYDRANASIRIYQTGTTTAPMVELTTAAAPAATTIFMRVTGK